MLFLPDKNRFIPKNYSSVFFIVCLFFTVFLKSANSASAQARLVLNNGGYVVINGNAAGNAYLVVENTATDAITRIGGSPKWIICTNQYSILKWQLSSTTGAHEYPFGYSTTDYLPVTINNSGNVGWMSVSTWITGADNTPVPSEVDNMQPSGATTDAGNMVIDRWWNINSSLASPLGSSVALSLSYRGAENTVTGGTDELGIQHWDDAGAKWDDGKGGADASYTATGTNGSTAAGAHTVSASGFTYFSPFILSRTAAPLPIKILSFSGNCYKETVLLQWETAVEINNDYFTIQRSFNAQNFETIGTKQGAGNSNTSTQYEFTDDTGINGTGYYRLKQSDFDGTSSYSPVIAVQSCFANGGNSSATIYIGENKEVVIAIKSDSGKRYTVSFYNALGQKMHSEMINVKEGSNVHLLNPKKMATGVYLITLQNEEETITQKLFMH